MDNRVWAAGASGTPPSAPASPSAGYPTSGNPSLAIEPTKGGAYWFHQLGEEMRAVLTAAGITPDHTNLAQLPEAIRRLIDAQSGNYALDTGAANAYVVALDPAIAAYADGMTVRVKVVNANTGAATLNAGGGVKSLATDDGGALAAGDIPAASVFTATYILSADKFYMNSMVQSEGDARYLDQSLFYKLDALTPAFLKTAAGTISVKAGTVAMAFGTKLKWAVDTAVTMPALTGGVDYAIYACTDGTIRADSSFTAPSGYTVNNSRMIGGFHYGLVAAGTTVAGGSFATAGTGMIWTQGDVDNIAGINKFSLWDLKFRSASRDSLLRGQKGFAYDQYKGFWLAIYEASTDTDANGLSKYNTNIASGTVVPKIPAAYGGNGVATYAAPTSWDFNEIAAAYGGRFVTHDEFCSAAFGVTENQSIGGAASTYPTTLRNAGYTSRIGIEQASGHHWTWGADLVGSSSTAYIANGGRGQSHADTIRRVILGGDRDSAANSGSRTAYFVNPLGNVVWNVGLRAACDHLQSA